MKVSEMKKLLRRIGCIVIRNGNNHEIWYSPVTNQHFTVPSHNAKELPTGTAHNIMKQAGLE